MLRYFIQHRYIFRSALVTLGMQKEICLLIEGKVTVSDADSSVSFGAGEMVIFPTDLECKWEITEAVSKFYTFE